MRPQANGRLGRSALLLLVLAVALIGLVACNGKTTGATNITATTATLNAHGSCAGTCEAYFEYRKVGDTTWTQTTHDTRAADSCQVNPTTCEEDYSRNVTGLTPATQYEFYVCASDVTQDGTHWGPGCEGPNASGSPTNPTDTFTTAAAPGHVSITASADDTTVTFTLPPGTASLDIWQADQDGYPVPAGHYQTNNTNPAPTGAWTPTRIATTHAPVWVDALARDSSGTAIGGWASDTAPRVKVIDGSPLPPPSDLAVMLNVGSWGAQHAADVKALVPWARVGDFLSQTAFDNQEATGSKILFVYHGCYSSSGVSGCGDPTTIANNAVNWFTAHTTAAQTPEVEAYNEPYGPWFWGANATSTTNKNAYAKLLKAFYTVFHPLGVRVAAAWQDNGWGGGASGWQNSTAAGGGVDNPLQYVDDVTVHAYGGSGGQFGGANGWRTQVLAAHTATGKAVLVSEVGWPTCGATGDSQNWTQAQQADNIYNFVTWARAQGTSVVSGVSFYNDVDQGGGACYGVWTLGAGNTLGSQKLAASALHNAALGLPEH